MLIIYIISAVCIVASVIMVAVYNRRAKESAEIAALYEELYEKMRFKFADLGAYKELLIEGVPELYLITYNYNTSSFDVCMKKEKEKIIIRSFPVHDDADYAARCAEELLDRLKEKI